MSRIEVRLALIDCRCDLTLGIGFLLAFVVGYHGAPRCFLTRETSMGEISYNTNLAAEFFVLSSLHRLGLTATLTVGNKKSVDVVVVRSTGDAVTIDVK